MEFDPLLLSRVQFAFTVAFHILFPGFTVGLASWLVVLEGLYLKTDNDRYLRMSKFWTKVFAVSFGMGVVSGVVMSFQFGTNWSRFADAAANVVGPLITYEVVTAFFLEATFLGVLLFGRERVPKGVHFFAALMVAFGTVLSSFWILSANSLMQTPDGVRVGEDGLIYVVSWWDAIFSPSFAYRFMHMVTAFYITTAFVIAGVSAYYLLNRRQERYARPGLVMAIGLLALFTPVQVFLGDLQGLNSLEYQPTKVAAMEGHWEAHTDGSPLVLFGIPDMEEETNHFEISVPYLSSLILTHSWTGATPGLLEVPPEDRPYVPFVFWSFRIMVGVGFLMMALGLYGGYQLLRGRLFTNRLYLRVLTWTMPLGFVSILTGWFTSEFGRQPWIIYNVMRTVDGITPSLTGWDVAASLGLFVVVYGFVFPMGVYYIYQLVKRGIDPDQDSIPSAPQAEREAGRPKRPLSLPDAAIEPAE